MREITNIEDVKRELHETSEYIKIKSKEYGCHKRTHDFKIITKSLRKRYGIFIPYKIKSKGVYMISPTYRLLGAITRKAWLKGYMVGAKKSVIKR